MKKSIFIFLVAAFLITGCAKNEKNQNQTSQNEPDKILPSYKNAIIDTSLGKISFELYTQDAPQTIENFANLAKSGFYNGTRVHYLQKDKMLIAGDPKSKESNKALWGFGSPGYNISKEINNQKIEIGTIAALNLGDQSHGSQFIIFTGQNQTEFEGKVSVFGKISSGQKILEEINKAQVDNQLKPIEDITINAIELK